MNKGRRQALKQLKYINRVKVFASKEDKPIYELIKSKQYIKWKSDRKPCSCYMCSPDKYSRKGKNKQLPNQ